MFLPQLPTIEFKVRTPRDRALVREREDAYQKVCIMVNLGQAAVGIILLLIVVGGLLWIFYSKTNAVEKTGFGSIIMLALVALMIPVFWIVEGGNQASATAQQSTLAIQRGMQTYGEQCTNSCFAIVNNKVVDATYNGYPMKFYWGQTDDFLRQYVSAGIYNPKALIQPINQGAIPHSDQYGGALSSNDIDYLIAFIRSTDPALHEHNGLNDLPAYLQANDATLYANAVTFGKEGQFGAPQDLTAQNEVALSIVDPGTNGVTCQSQSGCFTPINIKVKVGTRITWTNKSKLAHTIVAVQGTDISSPKPASQIFDSKVQIPTDGTFSYTVTDAAYNFNTDTHGVLYYCSIHPDMVAQIIVEK
ncbi:cupredoxin domain-containing protein [Dictyobacter arantiisoli]|uniref:Blue (type 1) copper domain-containing protein n=1 Tax=Dictyobacter arantiisoli TaxID=2014874 RepID=A0A5A5TCS9_9CHLR|nr:plastocyanin/azurin family copper-binding protein [Dictyobacter arantiisoli]GCF08833.1 hypothetical protein KDI_23970 [Dictyobacter arantiisoli]